MCRFLYFPSTSFSIICITFYSLPLRVENTVDGRCFHTYRLCGAKFTSTTKPIFQFRKHSITMWQKNYNQKKIAKRNYVPKNNIHTNVYAQHSWHTVLYMLLESFPALRNQNTIVSSSRALPKPCTVGNVIASVRNLINYYSCLTLLATAAALSSASCRHSAQPQAALEAVMKPKFQVEPTTISSFSLQE